MYLVLMVIDDPAKVDNVLDQLKIGGIAGATIVESTGLHRKRQKRIPLRYSYGGIEHEETDNLTLFAIVQNRQEAERCREIVESVVGDLDEPNTGIFAAWELDMVKGVPHCKEDEGQV